MTLCKSACYECEKEKCTSRDDKNIKQCKLFFNKKHDVILKAFVHTYYMRAAEVATYRQWWL